METKLQKRSILRWVLRLFLGAVALFGIAFAGGAWWVSSSSGQAYIQQRVLAEASTAAGYRIEAENVRLKFPLAVRIATLRIADTEGAWLEAQNVAASVMPTPQMLKHLVISSITAESLHLLKVPGASVAPPASGESEPMDVSVLGTKLKTLTLASAVTGLEQDITASFDGTIGWAGATEQLSVKADAHITSGIPELGATDITFSGLYHVPDNQLEISALKVTEARFAATGSGALDIAHKTVAAQIVVSPIALEQWVDELKGSVSVDAEINGSFNVPEIKATLQATQLVYQEKTLPALTAQLTAQMAEGSKWHGEMNAVSADGGKLNTDYRWGDDVLRLTNLAGEYQENMLTGTLRLHTETMLVGGEVNATIPAVEAFSAYLPHPMQGSATIAAKLTGKEGVQAADVIMDIQQLYAFDATLPQAHVVAVFPDVRTALPASFKAELTGLTYQDMRVEDATISASLKGDAWHVLLTADGTAQQAFSINLQSDIARSSSEEWSATILALHGSYGALPFVSKDTIKLISQPMQQSVDAPALTLGKGKIALTAKREDNQVSGKLTGKGLSLGKMGLSLPEAFSKAKADMTLALSGEMAAPVVRLEAQISGVKPYAKSAASDIQATVKLAEGVAIITASADDKQRLRSNVQATVPVQFSLAPFVFALNKQAPLKGNADLTLDVTSFAGLFLPIGHELYGEVKGDLALSGTVAAPLVNGDITLNKGGYHNIPLALRLNNIDALLTADNHNFTLTKFKAEDAKGNALTATGNATIASAEEFTYTMNLTAKRMALINHPNARGKISGEVQLKGDAKAGAITGALQSDELEITLPEHFVREVPELNIVQMEKTIAAEKTSATVAYPITLGLTLKADNKVFVRGWGVDAELEGKLAIKGTVAAPDIAGKLSTIRGRYEEFGKQFKLKQAELIFQGDMPPSPYLNVVASAEAADAEIMPTITGPILDPALAIKSSPVLPQEEALSLLLFGKDSTTISPVQAAQLANSLNKLSGGGGGGFDPIGKVRKLLDVDDISVNSNGEDATDTSVGIGKYIDDNIYLEIERGAESASSKARIEVELAPNISVESSTGGTGNSTVGVNWKRDY